MPAGLTRELIALRVARELRDGMAVNLGIGLPTLVSNYLPPDHGVLFQAENGILGYGAIREDGFDRDLINAGGQPVELRPGASFFHSADSFAMIRGGHIDVAVLGGLEVSARGDLANWSIPERGGGGIGGAMDLAVGARRVIVAMEHTTREGRPRIREVCDLPADGERLRGPRGDRPGGDRCRRGRPAAERGRARSHTGAGAGGHGRPPHVLPGPLRDGPVGTARAGRSPAGAPGSQPIRP